MDATEKLSQMMTRCGLATGHGDTIDDLIFELEKQIKNTSHAFSDAQKEVERLRNAETQNLKTIGRLTKMAARFHKALVRIHDLHSNSGDQYSEREINDMTSEIVVNTLAGRR
jgi:hypothetical protein